MQLDQETSTQTVSLLLLNFDQVPLASLSLCKICQTFPAPLSSLAVPSTSVKVPLYKFAKLALVYRFKIQLMKMHEIYKLSSRGSMHFSLTLSSVWPVFPVPFNVLQRKSNRFIHKICKVYMFNPRNTSCWYRSTISFLWNFTAHFHHRLRTEAWVGLKIRRITFCNIL